MTTVDLKYKSPFRAVMSSVLLQVSATLHKAEREGGVVGGKMSCYTKTVSLHNSTTHHLFKAET